jgi:pyruvate dehydrogenase E1 component alpha subunit
MTVVSEIWNFHRYHGHSMSDPGSTYRTRDEVTTMRQARDPVERVRKLLLDNEMSTAKELKAIEKKVQDEIEAVIKECTQAPLPELSMLQSNLYMQPKGVKMRGARSDQWIQATYKPYVKPT